MIIDANIFLGESLYRNSLTEPRLHTLMHQYGVDKVVVRPLKPSDHDFAKANQHIAEVQQAHTDIIGFGRVNPWERNAPRDVEIAITDLGLKGIHLHPWEENIMINSPVVYDVLDVAADLLIPVYISVGYPIVSEPLQVLEIADRYPTIPFICTHGANLDISGLSFDDALILAEDTTNVHFDISGVYRRDFIELLVEKAGANRILFGSNAPYMDIGLEIERVNAAEIDKTVKEKIFYRNILQVLSDKNQV